MKEKTTIALVAISTVIGIAGLAAGYSAIAYETSWFSSGLIGISAVLSGMSSETVAQVVNTRVGSPTLFDYGAAGIGAAAIIFSTVLIWTGGSPKTNKNDS